MMSQIRISPKVTDMVNSLGCGGKKHVSLRHAR
jgi:hypothetical protein